MNKSDKVLVADIRKAIEQIAALMNEAKKRNIVVNFSIPEVMVEGDPKFAPAIDIKRIVSL